MKDLVDAPSALYCMRRTSIKNLLESKLEQQDVINSDLRNAITLHQLVKKICNGSKWIVLDDVLGNFVEYLCSFAMIRG